MKKYFPFYTHFSFLMNLYSKIHIVIIYFVFIFVSYFFIIRRINIIDFTKKKVKL